MYGQARPSNVDRMVRLSWASTNRTKTPSDTLLAHLCSRKLFGVRFPITLRLSRFLQATSFTRRSYHTVHASTFDTSTSAMNSLPILDELGCHWLCSHHRSRKAIGRQPLPFQDYSSTFQWITLLLLHVCPHVRGCWRQRL